MQPTRSSVSPWHPIALAATLLTGAPCVLAASVDPATGILNYGSGSPQSNNLKFEVGPGVGQVRVINNLSGSALSFTGVRGINFVAGAGDDFIEFDINASQSLALRLSTGAGPADVKIQWKVPPGAQATASSLSMTSGGGDVNVELDFQSETNQSSFGWTTNFGGGNKLLKSKFAFKPGTARATKNINFANLGGGSHQVFMDVDNDAADGRFTLNSGFAQDVNYKVVSDNPSTRLDVNTIVRGARNSIEILSAAPNTNVSLRGGTANTTPAEAKVNVVQINGGTVNAQFDFLMGGFGGIFEGKFDGAASQLALSGRLLGTPGNDNVKLESNMATSATLALDCGAGTDAAEGPMPAAVNCESYIVK